VRHALSRRQAGGASLRRWILLMCTMGKSVARTRIQVRTYYCCSRLIRSVNCFQITFIVSRRPESRPQGGEGVSTALHSRLPTSPAVASGA